MKMPSLSLSVLTLMAGLLSAPAAHADWTFSSVSGGVSTATDGGIGVTASGVYAANGGGFVNNSAANYGISGFASGATWASSALISYSGGLGMSSDGSVQPNHAIDNGPKTNSSGTKVGLGNTEAVLLSFSSSVVLSSLTTGYVSGDSDFAVFKYDGTAAPSLTGTGAASMTGWTLVGNYNGVVNGGSGGTTLINSDGASSSWWLVSAYNSAWSDAKKNFGALDQGNDYFKLFAVAGSKPSGGGGSVPEPASIALVAAALLGVLGSRRRATIRR